MKMLIFALLIIVQISMAEVDIKRLERESKNVNYPEVMNILYNISIHYYILDDSLNLSKFAIQAINLAEKYKDIFMKIDALNNLSFVISYRDHSKALTVADLAYRLALENSYENGMCLALFLKGCSMEKNDPEKSLEYYYQSNKLAIRLKKLEIKAMSDAAIGDYFTTKGIYSNAMKYYFYSLKEFENLPDLNSNLMNKYLYGELLNNLGVSFKKTHNYEEAIKYYTKYKNLSLELGNVWGTSISLNNLGVVYYNKQDYHTAINNFVEARNQFEKIGALSFLPTIDNNLGNIYSTLGDYKQSGKYFDQALSQFTLFKDDIGIARCMANIGDLYLVMKRYVKSIKMFQSALRTIKDKDLEIQVISNMGISTAFDSLKKYSDAFKYHKIYSILKDSLTNTTRSEEITLMTQRYKDEKQLEEKDRLRLEQEKKFELEKARKNNLEYMGILILILSSFSFIFFYGKFKISPSRLESIVFIALLFLFTFISILTDPFVDHITNGDPLYKLIINVILALSLTPLDTFLEKIIRKRVILTRQDSL